MNEKGKEWEIKGKQGRGRKQRKGRKGGGCGEYINKSKLMNEEIKGGKKDWKEEGKLKEGGRERSEGEIETVTVTPAKVNMAEEGEKEGETGVIGLIKEDTRLTTSASHPPAAHCPTPQPPSPPITSTTTTITTTYHYLSNHHLNHHHHHLSLP